MPVMVVAADTAVGRAVLDRVVRPDREVRAFVSDPLAAAELRRRGVKVAVGDVSDSSHVAAASLRCFSLILVTAGAVDERERSFAPTAQAVLSAWAEAAAEAAVQRVIWVSELPVPSIPEVAETAVVDAGGDVEAVAEAVARLDDAPAL